MRAMSAARLAHSREHRLVLLLILAMPLALFALGRVLEPDARGWGTHEQLGFQPCFPMEHWNVPCPGCGVTTAVALLMHGSPLAALRTQPLGPIALSGALLAVGWALRAHARGRDLYAELPHVPWQRLAVVGVALAVGAWLYKLALVRGWLA